MYIYIYIYILVVPFHGSRARKLAPPAGFPAQKTIFEVYWFQLPFSLSPRLPERLQRLFLLCFSGSWDLLRTSKNFDSV